jgi:hypothetical protein
MKSKLNDPSYSIEFTLTGLPLVLPSLKEIKE